MMRGFFLAAVASLIVAIANCAQLAVDISALQETIGTERVQTCSAVKCSSYGFDSKASQQVLDNLLGKFDEKHVESEATIHDDGNKFLVFNSDKLNELRSDISFVYTHHMSLYDEESTLLNMQKGLKSITSGEVTDVTKKMFVLVVDGPQATAEYVKAMLEEAWATLLDKEDIKDGDIMAQIVVHIVSVNGPISDIAKQSVDSIVNDVTLEGKTLPAFFMKAPSLAVKAVVKTGATDQGIDICKEAVAAAIKWARDGANASLLRLQKIEAANEFADFVDRLILGAHGRLLEDCKKSGGASSSAIELAKEDIARNIYSMLGPIFRRHVLLAKQAAALQFNEAVGDDLEITIRILDDLNNAKYAALRTYNNAVRKLIPKTKGAPKSTWGTGFDQKQLEESLDDYINSRADQLRIQGVLSRGRKPVDISFNVFLNHPLGRDYRQNPLAAENGSDEPIYDENSVINRNDIVHPSLARAVLESPKGKLATQESKGWFKSGLGKKESEFAREMLMFPLSIKNPAVSLMASRSSKRKASAPPKKDPTRATLGPERFIRWDLEPLDEVKENLDYLLESRETKKTNIVDRVLNVVPFFGRGYYKHPPVSYGNKYTANPVSVKN